MIIMGLFLSPENEPLNLYEMCNILKNNKLSLIYYICLNLTGCQIFFGKNLEK